jgi:hypothetical protein
MHISVGIPAPWPSSLPYSMSLEHLIERLKQASSAGNRLYTSVQAVPTVQLELWQEKGTQPLHLRGWVLEHDGGALELRIRGKNGEFSIYASQAVTLSPGALAEGPIAAITGASLAIAPGGESLLVTPPTRHIWEVSAPIGALAELAAKLEECEDDPPPTPTPLTLARADEILITSVEYLNILLSVSLELAHAIQQQQEAALTWTAQQSLLPKKKAVSQ